MEVPVHEKVYGNVVNPEIPKHPRDRRRLLQRCLGARAFGYTVEGVTPHHVGSEGMLMLRRHFPDERLEITSDPTKPNL